MSFGSLRSHGQGYNSSATSSGLADLLACVAAFARSLEGRSTRTASSSSSQRMPPRTERWAADRVSWGRTFSVFARPVAASRSTTRLRQLHGRVRSERTAAPAFTRSSGVSAWTA